MPRAWKELSFKIPSQPNHSVILWFIKLGVYKEKYKEQTIIEHKEMKSKWELSCLWISPAIWSRNP